MKFSPLLRKFALLWLAPALLAGCSAFTQATPQALPTVVLDSGGGAVAPPALAVGGSGVTASGIVAPAQQARLVFALAGKVAAVDVVVGQRVQAGQALAHMEGQESLEAAISTAQFELVQAEQALEDLKTAAETARVQAMQDIITYEQALRDARYALDNFTVPANQAGLDTVPALNQMKLNLDAARAAFEPYKYRPSGDKAREDHKELLDLAQADYNTAVRRLQYEYDLEVAGAHLARALHDYEILKAGPHPDQLRLAEARRQNAQTQLASARAALHRLTLLAPLDGTVARIDVHSGEWVIAGQPILMLVDLDHLRVETTDLSERDVPRVTVGQPVRVMIKALQEEAAGRVVEIAPLAETLGGDVVYQAIIDLDTLPAGLRAGMSVVVQFGAGQ